MWHICRRPAVYCIALHTVYTIRASLGAASRPRENRFYLRRQDMLLQMERQARRSRQALRGRRHAGRVHGAHPSRGHGGQQRAHARGGHVREGAPHVELARVQEEGVRAPEVIEKLLSREARRKSKVMQVAVAYVRALRLDRQRHEAVLAERPALVRLGRVQAGALEVLSGAGGAGDDGDGALPRVGLAFLSPGAALAAPAGRVAVPEGVALGRARLVLLAVLRRRGDLAGVRPVLGVSVLALVVAVLVAVAEVCQGRRGGQSVSGLFFCTLINYEK